MFVDKAKIHLKAGQGGNGIISFLHDSRNPKGGPNGGNGGRGGDIILKAQEGISTLRKFESDIHFKAENGQDGGSNNRKGRDGKDLIVTVPPGTIVRNSDTGEIIAELEEPGEEATIVEGGIGGRGNSHFKSSTRRAPRICEKGAAGESLWVNLELKLLADVGIIGLPNAGKSSLLSSISASKTPVASYPFTTTEPHLGVVKVNEFHDFLAVDVPGLIKGAHNGKGLGDEFLRHIEKTKILLHLIDVSKQGNSDPVESYQIIKRELNSFSQELARKPEIVVGNKIDLLDDKEVEEVIERFQRQGIQLETISVATSEGVNSLIQKAFGLLKKVKEKELREKGRDKVKRKVYKYEPKDEFRIEVGKDAFFVEGEKVEDLLRLSLENTEAQEYFYQRLEQMGVIDELENKGLQEGDTIVIGGMEFEYQKME